METLAFKLKEEDANKLRAESLSALSRYAATRLFDLEMPTNYFEDDPDLRWIGSLAIDMAVDDDEEWYVRVDGDLLDHFAVDGDTLTFGVYFEDIEGSYPVAGTNGDITWRNCPEGAERFADTYNYGHVVISPEAVVFHLYVLPKGEEAPVETTWLF